MNLIITRALFVIVCAITGTFLSSLGLHPLAGAALGVVVAGGMIGVEIYVRRIPFQILASSTLGFLSGFGVAVLLAYTLERLQLLQEPSLTYMQLLLLFVFGYAGFAVGAKKGELLSLKDIQMFFQDQKGLVSRKILDTSVIIDGRIADLCETGFIEGVLIIPQFILRELQYIADSSDSMKRNRGRRGLDILQRMQKMSEITVEISEDEFSHLREVDLKLIELAKKVDAKIVTNDFNLNKVCQLRGVAVLNINELANALKPVVLPGEGMKVFVIKEGKDVAQGVAYLDDGTMVVVDNARKYIGKTIDITVTSVLQTTAGKMIFGRYESVVEEKPEEKGRRPGEERGEERGRRGGEERPEDRSRRRGPLVTPRGPANSGE